MSLMLPGEVEWVLNLLGFNWPQADEDKLHDAANAWRSFAQEVDDVRGGVERVVGQVKQHNRGEAIDAFVAYASEFQRGDQGHLHDVSDTARTVGNALDAFAVVVVGMKMAVIAQLTAFAAEFTADQVGAFFTLGASEAALPAEIAVTRFAMREIEDGVVRQVEHDIVGEFKRAAIQKFKEIIGKDLRRWLSSKLKGLLADFKTGIMRMAKKDAEREAEELARAKRAATERPPPAEPVARPTPPEKPPPAEPVARPTPPEKPPPAEPAAPRLTPPEKPGKGPHDQKELDQASQRKQLIDQTRRSNPRYLTIHRGAHGKHVPGDNNFIPGRSELTHPDPEGLLEKHAFTGQPLRGTPGQPGFKERIDFREPIGTYVTPGGARATTTKGVVHYSSRGAHIVPAHP